MILEEPTDYLKNPKNPGRYKPIEYEIDENGCWICTSHSKDKDGYPGLNRWVNGKLIRKMSRYVVFLFTGQLSSPEKGEVIMHLCDNPSCINPDHLKIGTYMENRLDMLQKGRERVREGLEHGHAKDIEVYKEIVNQLKTYKDKKSHTQIAKELGVSQPLVSKIAKGEHWFSKEIGFKMEAKYKRTGKRNHSTIDYGDEIFYKIKEELENGTPALNVSRKLNVSSHVVYEFANNSHWWLKEKGLTVTVKKKGNRRYDIDFEGILKDLKEGKMSKNAISKKYRVHRSVVEKLANGTHWYLRKKK